MSFITKLRNGEPTLSCEFFPPKNSGEWSTLYQTMGRIARLQPDFVSVTYGAGGSTREKTVGLVHRIESELGIEAMAHLTCVGHSRSELEQILAALKAHSVTAIMALRGDAPKGADKFVAHADGFAHATDLIALARADRDLTIGCAFYPEKHTEAHSLDTDIAFLKLKQDSGADFAASQIFFNNESFYKFRDKAAAAGVTIPLVAGILPVTSRSQVGRIAQMCGTIIPAKLQRILDNVQEGDSVKDAGVEFAAEQSADLLNNGIGGIHLYTFNLSNSSVKVIAALRALGHFPLTSDSEEAA